MKIYKNILKAFGGAGLYIDKIMLNHLGVLIGDEVTIELKEEGLLIRKPELDVNKVQELLDAKTQRRN